MPGFEYRQKSECRARPRNKQPLFAVQYPVRQNPSTFTHDSTGSKLSKDFAVEVHDLRKTYASGLFWSKRFEALKGISFNVERGQTFGLLGPNGAGKTTFLKILMGIIGKSSGNARMLGQPAGSREGRKKIGYLPEQLRMLGHLNAFSALELYGNLSNIPTRVVKEKRDGLLEQVGLSDWGKVRVGKFSKGMRQRLGLAQALLHDPELLILDEPTDGLDPRARAEMRAIINQLSDKGVTVFLNSHILQEVELICDHVAILDQGELKYSGPVEQLDSFVSQMNRGSGAAELIVEFELAGNLEHINEIFSQGDMQQYERVSGDSNQHRFKVSLADQAAIDARVDHLRQKHISILGLSKQQITLESAFLQLIADPQDKTPSFADPAPQKPPA